mgnify:CR=1 FL=1
MDYNKNIFHTEKMPKGIEIQPKKDKFSKKELSEFIGTDNYNIIELEHNNAIIVYDKDSNDWLNTTCTMMIMAFAKNKAEASVIFGNALITSKNRI